MLPVEARWFRNQFRRLPNDELFPLLNIGSQTEDFRTREQPWIHQFIFAPLQKRRGLVVHTDLQAAQGVDLAGDLTDPAFVARVREKRFRSVICSNLLEHVVNRGEIARLVTEVVEPGGYLFVSVPYKYPYHPDPIDTMFRPDLDELAGLFPGTTRRAGVILPCGTYARDLAVRAVLNPGRVAKRLLAGFRRPAAGTGEDAGAVKQSPERSGSVGSLFPWLFRNFYVTCLVLQRNPA